MNSTSTPWFRVSHKHPCPICRHPDWCTVSQDGQVACCMRNESPKRMKNGGWLHRLADAPARIQWSPPPPPRRREQAEVDFAAMHRAWYEDTMVDRVAALADALGVWYRALARIGAAWAPQHMAWAFPMRDAAGAVIGVRLRAEDGRKWAVRGSRAGLIYDPAQVPGDGLLLVCEGPTDTAAAMTAGHLAVGRPSCRGQEDLLRGILGRHRGEVVIVADNDPPHERPDGKAWRPGLDGALDLARELRRPCRIIVPPVKDLREWVRTGADVAGAIANAAWINVR